MRCPKCKKDCLEKSDDSPELVCEECGTAFLLEEDGWYEEGGDEKQYKNNPYFKSKKGGNVGR